MEKIRQCEVHMAPTKRPNCCRSWLSKFPTRYVTQLHDFFWFVLLSIFVLKQSFYFEFDIWSMLCILVSLFVHFHLDIVISLQHFNAIQTFNIFASHLTFWDLASIYYNGRRFCSLLVPKKKHEKHWSYTFLLILFSLFRSKMSRMSHQENTTARVNTGLKRLILLIK